jgi:short-subunit dehydrogenase
MKTNSEYTLITGASLGLGREFAIACAKSLLTRLMIENLKRQPRAWIMNISSMAAFSPMPFKTLYPASKAFVYYFSRGLAEELKDTRISVSVVHPGPMMTNDEVSSRIRKHGFSGRICLLPAERIADFSNGEMLKGKKVIIPGFMNRINWILLKLVPLSIQMSLLSGMVRRELGHEIIKLPERNGEISGYVSQPVLVSTSVA